MSRSRKKNWISSVNCSGFKTIANKKIRKKLILDKNGDEVLSGKNNKYRKLTCSYNIRDYSGTWGNVSFSKRKEDYPEFLKEDYYETKCYFVYKTIILPDGTHSFKRILLSHTEKNRRKKDLFYKMWMK